MASVFAEEGTPVDTMAIVSDPTTRYFLIKSYNHDNIGRSLQHGVWATSQRNERVLNHAYETTAFVVLIFSVNHSSRFSGFALMTSSSGESPCEGRHVFCGPDGTPFPGRMFGVHWVTKDCEHILNSFNENKPVKVGRDGQEIDPQAGRQLCLLIDSCQPPESRPSPLHLDPSCIEASLSRSTVVETAKPADTRDCVKEQHASGGSATIENNQSVPSSGVPPPKLAKQLSVVANFLKRGHAATGETKKPKACNPSVSAPLQQPTGFTVSQTIGSPSEKINDFAQAKSNSVNSTLPVSWNFDWVEKAILENPILSIFPVDLTQLESYESYERLYENSKALWEQLECTYGATDIPPFPSSLKLTEEQQKAFDAEVLVTMLSRSASQESVDTLLEPFLASFPATVKKVPHLNQFPANGKEAQTIPSHPLVSWASTPYVPNSVSERAATPLATYCEKQNYSLARGGPDPTTESLSPIGGYPSGTRQSAEPFSYYNKLPSKSCKQSESPRGRAAGQTKASCVTAVRYSHKAAGYAPLSRTLKRKYDSSSSRERSEGQRSSVSRSVSSRRREPLETRAPRHCDRSMRLSNYSPDSLRSEDRHFEDQKNRRHTHLSRRRSASRGRKRRQHDADRTAQKSATSGNTSHTVMPQRIRTLNCNDALGSPKRQERRSVRALSSESRRHRRHHASVT